MIILLLTWCVFGVSGDYDCLCNYNVEKGVYSTVSAEGQPVGYLYEFDCKELIESSADPKWASVAFEHQIGYVEKDAQTRVQVCPGDPSAEDKITTTTSRSTTSTTFPPTSSSTLSSTVKSITTSTSSTSTLPSTTTYPTSTKTTSKASTTMTTSAATTSQTSATVPSTSAYPTTTVSASSSTLMSTTVSASSSTSMSTSRIPSTTPLTTARTSTSAEQTTMPTTQRTLLTNANILTCPLSIKTASAAEQATLFVSNVDQRCYELVHFPRTWSFAEDDCVRKGGHLASVNSQAEEQLIHQHIKSYGLQTWIGLNDKNIEEMFEWTSGEPMTYQNWASGRYSASGHRSEDCVAIQDIPGTWDDVECHTYLAYICEFDAVYGNHDLPTTIPMTRHFSTQQTSSTLSPAPSLCPTSIQQAAVRDGAELFSNPYDKKCYEFVKTKSSWLTAENHCTSLGGHLVTTGDFIEEDIIYRHVKEYGHVAWIGLNDRMHEEDFRWTSGEPLTYENWHTGSKDSLLHTFENCVGIGSLTGTWEDLDCSNSYAYICEFDSNTNTSTQNFGHTLDGDISQCPSSVQHLAARDSAVLGQHDRSCYELIPNQRVSWQNGEDLCTARGGHLAHILSSSEQTFVQTFLNNHLPQHAVWIGLHDTRIEGTFEWTSGDSVRFTNWIPGHESNFQGFRTEDCVAIIPYKNGYWDDITCGDIFDLGETHYVLCQYSSCSSLGLQLTLN